METFKDFVVKSAPALKEAFVKAFKVGAYIILSTAIAAIGSYVTGSDKIDPVVVFAINAILAAAKKFVDEFGK